MGKKEGLTDPSVRIQAYLEVGLLDWKLCYSCKC